MLLARSLIIEAACNLVKRRELEFPFEFDPNFGSAESQDLAILDPPPSDKFATNEIL